MWEVGARFDSFRETARRMILIFYLLVLELCIF